VFKKSHGFFGSKTITHKASRRALLEHNGCPMCIELLPLAQLSDQASKTSLKARLFGASETKRNEFAVSFKFFESKRIKSGLHVSLPGLRNDYHFRLSVSDGKSPFKNNS